MCIIIIINILLLRFIIIILPLILLICLCSLLHLIEKAWRIARSDWMQIIWWETRILILRIIISMGTEYGY